MSDTTIRSSEILSDPERFVREMRAGRTVSVSDLGYTVLPQETELLDDMVSLRPSRTGIDCVIFVSTGIGAQHAPRIKIAVDPPDSLNAASASASMTIHDYKVTGAYLPTHIVEQAKRFIERNHDILLRYWNCEIDTEQLIDGLRA
jgi:hypothetical protein